MDQAAAHATLDQADIGEAVRAGLREDARRARLEEQLSRLIGPFESDGMSDDELAEFGLEKLGHRATEGLEDPMVILEFILADRALRSERGSMDSAPQASFLDKYLTDGAKNETR